MQPVLFQLQCEHAHHPYQLQELDSQAIPRAVEIHSLPFWRANGRFAWPEQCWPQNVAVSFWEPVGCTLSFINQSHSSCLKRVLTPVTFQEFWSVFGILHKSFPRPQKPAWFCSGAITHADGSSHQSTARRFKHAPKTKLLWDLFLSSGFTFGLSLWTFRTFAVATTQDTSCRGLRE